MTSFLQELESGIFSRGFLIQAKTRMGKTPIEWTDHSVNPFRARNKRTGAMGHCCVKVSPGCKKCYSSRLQPRLGAFPFLAENRDKVELVLDNSKLLDVARRKKPTKYFWCDMTDMFWEEYPDSWIDQCIGVMAWTKQHIHQVLTKRSDRLLKYSMDLAALSPKQRSARMARSKGFEVSEDSCGDFTWPLPNVWFGCSVENQQYADERIPLLLATPAATRFVSYEPVLGPVDFTPYLKGFEYRVMGQHNAALQYDEGLYAMPCGKLDWIIAGFESGPGARLADEDWIRAVKNQCVAAEVAFFYKQKALNGHKISTPELDGQQWKQFPSIEVPA